MGRMTAPSLRARVRAEMIEEIKSAARRHLAADGANLSLRAVARELGMVSSALYRYFASRDDLLTALIVDAYDAVGATAEAALDEARRRGVIARWVHVTAAIRRWALANPHEYALIYGSPVPGYRAPQDTVGPASRPTLVLGAILRDGVAAGRLSGWEHDVLPRGVAADLRRLTGPDALPGVPVKLLARGMAAWIQLFGTVSFELFGRFINVLDDPAAFFDLQMRRTAAQLGLGTPPSRRSPRPPRRGRTPGASS